MTSEHKRLEEARTGAAHWKKWGPYLSERQWGTVREDYSDGGDAWNFFVHDHARPRAGGDVREYLADQAEPVFQSTPPRGGRL